MGLDDLCSSLIFSAVFLTVFHIVFTREFRINNLQKDVYALRRKINTIERDKEEDVDSDTE